MSPRILTTSLLFVALTSPSGVFAQASVIRPAETSAALSPKQVTEIGLRGACWILNGTPASYRWHGSGWVLDKNKRLLVTNDHVIAGMDVVSVYFPVWEAGKLNRDDAHYLKNVKALKATVIDRDKNRDLALLQVESIPDGIHELKLAGESAEAGDLLRTVGALPAGNKALWGTVSGEVRLLAPRDHPNGGRCMMVTTTIPTNGGNSGGAILNDRGEVVAVVEGGYDGQTPDGRNILSVTMHVDLSELRAFLDIARPFVEPIDAETFVKRAERRLFTGRVDQASSDFSEALKKDRKHVKAMIGRGKLFAQKGDHATAIGDFDAALKIDEDSFDALYARGMSRAKIGKVEDAIADLTAAIRIQPDNFFGYNGRAIIHSDFGKDHSAAIRDYSRAIELAPTDPVLWSNRAYTYEIMGKLNEAVADLTQMTKITPNSFGAWEKLGRLCVWKAKRFDEAIAAFKKANELNPNEAIHLADLGDAYLEAGNNELARKTLTEALTINLKRPTLNAPYTFFRRGLACKNLKDNEGAFGDFSTAIKLNPKYAYAYLYRGRLLKELGKESEGQADIDQASKLDKSLVSKMEVAPEAEKGLDLLGSWEFNGELKGVPMYLKTTLLADGTVISYGMAKRRDGVWVEAKDTGTYTVVGNRLIVNLKQLGNTTVTVVRVGNTTTVTQDDGTVLTYRLVK